MRQTVMNLVSSSAVVAMATMAKSAKYEIIDAHYHHHQSEACWRIDLENAARRGITQIWVSDVPWKSADYPVREEVEFLNGITAALVRDHGRLFKGFVYVDPKDEANALADVRRAIEEQHMTGIKLWVSCFCDDACVFPIAEYAQEHRIPMLVHAWDKATGNMLFESKASHVADLARRFPELPVIMAHHGGDWIHACRHIEHLPNVRIDVCGSIADHGLVDYTVRYIGAKRVLFGTDTVDFFSAYGKVAGARLDEEAKRLIFSGNALRILEAIR